MKQLVAFCLFVIHKMRESSTLPSYNMILPHNVFQSPCWNHVQLLFYYFVYYLFSVCSQMIYSSSNEILP